MKARNKSRIFAAVLGAMGLIGLMGLITGCASTFGASPSAPSKFESLVFNTQTNYITQTNVVTKTVTNQVTETVTVTNSQNLVIPIVQTNQVVQTVTVTNTVQVPQYIETPKASVTTGVQVAGGIANTFAPGVGTIASSALAALLGFWGYLRSSKLQQANDTTAVLAQNIESILEVVQALPNGSAMANTIKTFIAQHQAEAGVVQQVVQVLENDVSNPDAKTAAQQIINAVNALKATTTNLPNVSAA